MTRGAESGEIGCGKVLGYGCIALVLIAVVGGVAIWAGWDLLAKSDVGRGVAESVAAVKEQVEAVNALRERLAVDYPAEDWRANFHVHHGDGATTRTLRLTIAGPRFELPDTAEGRLAKAREIAAAVAARFPDLGRYDALSLEIVTRSSGDVASTTSSSYEFPTAELLDGVTDSEPDERP